MGVEYKVVSCKGANGKCEPVDAVLKILVDVDITQIKCPRYSREMKLGDKPAKTYECYCGSLDKNDAISEQNEYNCLYKRKFS